jgi:hypothetical protein
MRTVRWFLPVLLLLSFPVLANADVVTFEGLADGTVVTNQFSNLIFLNATIATAGPSGSLNADEFPPHSGENVVFDDGGPMSISFIVPASTVSGFFNYGTRLTLTAFDSSNNVIGTTTSAFNSNLGVTGDPGSHPNEVLSFSFVSGISRIVIAGDPEGTSFTLDDLTVATVPEPSALYLLTGGALTFITFLRKRRVN